MRKVVQTDAPSGLAFDMQAQTVQNVLRKPFSSRVEDALGTFEPFWKLD